MSHVPRSSRRNYIPIDDLTAYHREYVDTDPYYSDWIIGANPFIPSPYVPQDFCTPVLAWICKLPTPEAWQDGLAKGCPNLEAQAMAGVYEIRLVLDDHKQTMSLKLLQAGGNYSSDDLAYRFEGRSWFPLRFKLT